MLKNFQVKVFCIILGVSFAFQDIRDLGRLLGPSGASISGIIMFLAFTVITKSEPKKTENMYIKELIIFTGLISLILLPTQDYFLYGETVWVKAIKVAASMVVLLISFKYGQTFFVHHGELLAYVAFPFLLTMYLGVFLERIELFPNVEKSFFHYTQNFTQRPRGFATEPSTLAYSISIGIGLIGLLSTKRVFRQLLLLCLVLSGFVVTVSRGYIGAVALTVLLVFLILILKRIGRSNVKLKAAFITTLLLTQSLFIGLLLRSNLWSNFSKGTSDTTREAWAAMTVTGLSQSPFGAGYQGLITAAPNYLKEYTEKNSIRFSGSNLRELILTYSQSSDFAISPKTITSLFVITSGIFGFAFVFLLIYKIMYLSLRNEQIGFWELFGIVLTLITLVNYAGGLSSFSAFFILGFFIERFKVVEMSASEN